METLRLRKMQLSQVERLLDACIARSKVLPKDFYQIRDMDSDTWTADPQGTWKRSHEGSS